MSNVPKIIKQFPKGTKCLVCISNNNSHGLGRHPHWRNCKVLGISNLYPDNVVVVITEMGSEFNELYYIQYENTLRN